MAIKENLPDAAAFALPGFGLLALEGPDAEAFAQSQFMNDVRSLAAGQWQWNGWLTPKGRVVALFALLRIAPGQLLLVLPDHPADALAAALQRFVFRSKVRLVLPETWQVGGSWQKPAVTTPAEIVGSAPEKLILDWGTAAEPRCLLLSRGHLFPADAEAEAAWLAYDIAHGLPRLGATQVEAWTPQMLSLQRLSAFSLQKGCYPGQEIVARTHFLGQAKRGLVRIAGQGLSSGATVEAEGRSLGQIVCATRDGDEALAVLSEGWEAVPLRSGAGSCQALPLREGLQRGH